MRTCSSDQFFSQPASRLGLSNRTQRIIHSRHVVEKLAERLSRVGAQILKLGDELAGGLLCDGGGGDGGGFVLEKVAIVGGLELHLEVVQRLALSERGVVVRLKERGPVAADYPLEVARLHVE